ncbi:hypothetical protein RRG08_061374 [Elysia crispata]|uniref:Uncharacterized protein n=1 Tax=Elysia crispata TaxID=231223 RepID=A0AAE1DZ19_9GAST|nr:hypothetical protein RRG08_061374 [Elysia crispata]
METVLVSCIRLYVPNTLWSVTDIEKRAHFQRLGCNVDPLLACEWSSGQAFELFSSALSQCQNRPVVHQWYTSGAEIGRIEGETGLLRERHGDCQQTSSAVSNSSYGERGPGKRRPPSKTLVIAASQTHEILPYTAGGQDWAGEDPTPLAPRIWSSRGYIQ